MSNANVLEEIHSGVKNLISEQQNFEHRIADIERTAGFAKRKSWVAGGAEFTDDVAGGLLRMAAAQIMAKDGTQNPLVKAGFSSQMAKVIGDYQQKALDTGTTTSGGWLVPQDYINALIEMLRANMTVVLAGATVMEKLTGSPVIIPKQLTSASGSWIGQNATVSLSDPSFGQVTLTPKVYGIRAQFSNLLNILSNPSSEGITRRDLAKVAGLELDRVALRGSGASNQPLGLNGVSGLGTYAIATNGGDFTRQDALKLAGVVEDQNALTGKLAFITSPKVTRVMKNERIAQFSGQTTGEYVQYPLTNAALAKSLDYPIFTTTQIPATLVKGSSSDCAEVYFGNFEELLIGMWGPMEILATNIGGNAWAQNAIEVRLIRNVDIAVRHGQSFALCSDARTNNA